ncbi:major facilitator superfamily domain-containing protein [Lactarius sanguifluus]|nr:major facilitator superfamily domain-containing protein [Lactarius sanguifluus]
MSLTGFENSHEIDEETLLLPDQEDLNPTQTPLPTAQISILLTRLAESTLSSSMGSYLSQLLRELPEVGGDARKVGYYMGIIVSLFCAAEAVTSFPWNRLSDHVGRKPVLLSCLVGSTLSMLLFAAMFACLSLVITGLYLEETLNSRSSEKPPHARPNSDIPQEEIGDSPGLDMTPPLRSVLTKPVVVSVTNYAMFALLGAIVATYFPLVWSTPVEYGGLDLSPASIGLWLSVHGGIGGFFQFVFFSRFISRFGLRRVFVSSIVSCAVIYTLFPFENLAAVGGGRNIIVWLLIVLQISSYCVFDMGYSAMNMYVSSAAPNRRSLGAVYGLSLVATSVLGTVGPAAAGWLFAFSLTHNVLGGTFAYIVLLGVVCIELGVSTQLPKNTWAHREE